MQEFQVKYQPYEDQIVKIDDSIQVNLLKPQKLISNPGRLDILLESSLKNPINSQKLSSIIAKKAQKIRKERNELNLLIIVDDHTRSTPVRLLIPYLLVYFAGCGIIPERILLERWKG